MQVKMAVNVKSTCCGADPVAVIKSVATAGSRGQCRPVASFNVWGGKIQL